MSFTLVRPASVSEALDLVCAAPLPWDSPTQHRHHDRAALEPVFASGRRTPDLVWAARRLDGRLGAVACGLAVPGGIAVENWGFDDPDALALVLDAVTEYARAQDDAEFSLFVPPGVNVADPVLAPWHALIEKAGWRLLVERLHYEFEPGDALVAALPEPRLRLEPLTGPDDPRLPALQRRVLEGTLDAHDRDVIAQRGLDAAVAESLGYLLDSDPWECLRLAFPEALADAPGHALDRHREPEPIGYVSWRTMSNGRGYVLVVGVAHDARGHRYGTDLLAQASRALVAEGATTLIADTDVPNRPMAAAFARCGWPVTEGRVDYQLGRP